MVLDLPVFDALYMSARRNHARDTLMQATVARVVAHGEKKQVEELQKELEEIIGVHKDDVANLNEFLEFAGRGW